MVEQPDTFWYCLRCGAENEAAGQFCHDCGVALSEQRGHDRKGVAFLLNELYTLHVDGVIGDELFLRLRERYREVLRRFGAAQAPQPDPAPPSSAACALCRYVTAGPAAASLYRLAVTGSRGLLGRRCHGGGG